MNVTNTRGLRSTAHGTNPRAADALRDPLAGAGFDPLTRPAVQAKAKPGARGLAHPDEEQEEARGGAEEAEEAEGADEADVQAQGADLDGRAGVHRAAAAGVSGSGGRLPHLDRIQTSFGGHDVRGVQAHTDGPAQRATQDLGAVAYASGDHVAFGSASPDLHTAAHESAHVVQQRGGVNLKGKVGRSGDAHERHADAVADAVVAGRSAEPLLDAYAPSGGTAADGNGALQRKDAQAEAKLKTEEVNTPVPVTGHLQRMFTEGHFVQIDQKLGKKQVLLRALTEAFANWLADPSNPRESALKGYQDAQAASEKALAEIANRPAEGKKEEAKKAADLKAETKKKEGAAKNYEELQKRGTAESLAEYHQWYTCNAFTQFLLTRADLLGALQAGCEDYETYKEAVKDELVKYYTDRLVTAKDVKWNGWVNSNIGMKTGDDAGWRGDKNEAPKEIERGKKESDKAWKKRVAKYEKEKKAHDREQAALDAYAKRSGKAADTPEARKAAQLMQFEGQSVLIHVKRTWQDKKGKHHMTGGDHFFLGYVTKGKNPELQTLDHQNNPLRVGPFPLFDLKGPKNGEYFWWTFVKATPKA